jgi:hypothetical protein
MDTRIQLRQNKGDTPTKPQTSLRCCCGSLLARVIAEGVEIKCRRCKRKVVLPIDGKGTLRITM